MASRDEIVCFLDEYLCVPEIHDVALNGLQVEGKSDVLKIGFAVDACMDVFSRAQELSCDMVIVHHGMFWERDDPSVVGMMKGRVKALIDSDMSLYAAHLPIDMHPESGNNAVIARLLGLKKIEPFGEYHGELIGFSGSLPKEVSRDEFASIVGEKIGKVNVAHQFGSQKIRTVGVVSGCASFAVREAHERGLDALVSGEAMHEAFNTTKELEMNAFYLGHYASETFGVKAIADVLKKKFSGIECVFIDSPTGL